MIVTVWLLESVEVKGCVVFPTCVEPVNVTVAVIVSVPVVFPATVKEIPDLSKTKVSNDHEVE